MKIKDLVQNLKWWLFPYLFTRKKASETNYFIRKSLLEQNIVYRKELGISSEKYTSHDIIVSLTTYGKRIYDVALTIETIMEQTMRPNKIILWLDYSFEGKKLPASLLALKQRGLEIAFCKDLGPYTKLHAALCRFPEDAIITIDDDVLYDYDMIERLIQSYIQDPHYIYCHRCHRMTFDKKGVLKPYNDWIWSTKDIKESHLNFATGVGGVLYPPHALDEEAKNETVFMDICKSADDVWWNAMALKKGTKVKKVYTRNPNSEEYLLNTEVQDIGLNIINTRGKNLNDIQIKRVYDKYNLWDRLR